MNASRAQQIDLLDRLLRTTRELVAQVPSDAQDRPTPCADFDLGTLVAHLIGWQQVFAARLRGTPAPIVDGSPTYRPCDDLKADLSQSSKALLAALASESDEVELPYRGRTSVDVLVAELIAETALHSWDIATALDLGLELDAPTLAAAHEGLTLLLGEPFSNQGFRPTVVTPDAPANLGTLLRRSGRDPADGVTT
jgi:uncharacterized protein (TIGR03086 family)